MTFKTCAHCGKRFEAGGSLFREGVDYPLCHPDEGLDCYRLVTVYGERIGCRKDPDFFAARFGLETDTAQLMLELFEKLRNHG